jgi:hypothetical protein
MKNKKMILGITVMVIMVLVACNKGRSSGSANAQSGGKTINSADELKEYLDKQPVNSPDKPIKVSMTINDPMLNNIAELINSSGKYVSLDITGNALTFVGDFFCRTIVSINIPNSVTSISNNGGNAFNSCYSLTTISVDTTNSKYSSDHGVLYNKDKTELIFCPRGKSGEYIIPSSVTEIGDRAFSGCESLTNITIPNSVTSIGSYGNAFSSCSSLTNITIPNGVTKIGDNDFSYCKSLISVTIPNSVTSIGQTAFSGCSSLTKIIIPNSVTLVEYGAFSDCTSLTSVTFDGNISSFSDFAISGNLRDKYIAGGIGTYTRPNGDSKIWTKQ